MRGYRADTAFDGERAVPGGALVLVEGDQIVGVEAGSAPAPGDCPVTEDLSDRVLRLPLYNDLGETEQAYVIESLHAFAG